MEIEIARFVTGPIETNSYVISNAKKACVIDPSSDCNAVLAHIDSAALIVEAIVLTHGHFDHVLGIPEILDRFPSAPVWIHPDDRPLLTKADYNGSFLIGRTYTYTGPLQELSEETQRIGSFECRVLHVPGHTPGGCALIFEGHCFSGDSLFAGSVGRSDFDYSDGPLLIKSIKEKLFNLPDTTIVYPGHGGRTTIGREKRLNPFVHE